MEENKEQEAIEKYLRNRMPSEEAAAFEKKLATNEALSTEVAIQRQMINAVKAAQEKSDFLDMLNDIEMEVPLMKTSQSKEIPIKNIQSTKSATIRRFSPMFAIAASIALLVSLVWLVLFYNSAPTTNQLAHDFFTPYEDVLTTALDQAGFAGNEENGLYKTQLTEAMLALDKGNLEKAQQQLKAYKEANNQQTTKGLDDQLVDFYLAQIAFQDKNYQESIQLLQPLTNIEVTVLQIPVRWYLALAYLGVADTEKAKQFLNEIPKNDSQFGDKVIMLLQKL